MYKRGKLTDIFGDFIIFRELNPVNKNLPQFERVKKALSLEKLPRKKDKDYVKVLSYIFSFAGGYKRIFYIGDTLMSDLSVINSFSRYTDFETFGIITREGELNGFEDRGNFVLNGKWKNLQNVFSFCEKNHFTISEDTVFIIDIDKTAIGARGRNDKAIDRARMDAIKALAGEIFGEVNKEEFSMIYDVVNKKDFFYITEDNQDIVSIVSFLVYDGALSLEQLGSGEFENTISLLSSVKPDNTKLEKYVQTVLVNVEKGNPTAFPEFRKKEFEKTILRTDFLADETLPSKLLSEEILITGEVYDLALIAKEKGAFVFGVSDKPALSTMPQNSDVFPPVYEKVMKIYSEG